ncbi:MAG TPA: hypothetical protein VHA80_04190 [Solirubrobacterales bacterium]|nr:hypothetical protein [Solirubrobacterales bacterium]
MRAVVSILAALLGFGAVTGTAWALYSGTTSSTGNALVASSDWVAPTVSGSVIAKSQGGVAGYIGQGGSYYAYANATDAGAPASGLVSIAANLGSLTAGQSAAPLSPGSFSAGGASYGYRSAALTANATLAAGTYSYALSTKDVAGNSRTQSGYTVVVDNTAPTASDIQTTNKSGNTAGRPEIGDTVIFTFSEPIDPNSIVAGWTGAATNVVARIANGNPDTLTVWSATNTVQLPLGSVALGRSEYVSSSATFGATGTPSSMVQSGNTITVTLGTASAGPTTALIAGTMTWTPSSSAYDWAGNPESTAARTESGASDREF